MLNLLERALSKLRNERFPDLSDFKTKNIDYTPPKVFRLWLDAYDDFFGVNYRILFHRIFNTNGEKAYYHPHSWASAMLICKGSYLMEIGTQDIVAGTILMTEGSRYQMMHPHGWHSVAPITEYCDTIMVTAFHVHGRTPPIQPPAMPELSEPVKLELYDTFKNYVMS